MGNIADALKKAGVGLPDQPVENDHPIDDVTDIREVEQAELFSAETDIDETTAEFVQRTPLNAWDERIELVANKSSQIAEVFRGLRSRILFPQNGKPRPRTIMVASSAPEEGKSFVSVNLAVAIARGLDQYSLLVDCDLRRPSLARLLGLQAAANQGLAEFLEGKNELSELICKTSVEKLSVLTAGSVPVNPAELLTSGKMSRLVNELSGRYSDRFIIFDSPPFQVASESIVLTKKVDGVVLVVGYGKSDRVRIKEMVDTIGQDKIIGVVFNGMKESYIKKKMFDYYGGYGKYYAAQDNQ
jgi:exopolysaccharide/PEP-CTERM locus tyrosine autokinase